MGVYHFMGLGRSVGTITGPISYLAMRYNRWNLDDRIFFGSSGEYTQRSAGNKVGDIQAIVLFTTPEVYTGQACCFEYIENTNGQCPQEATSLIPGVPMRDALLQSLPAELKLIGGGRDTTKLYWCEVDRTNLLGAFQRVSEVLLAAKSAGKLGKEVWVNLTGGNNVINLALQLSTTLTRQPARLYYVMAENSVAEKCIRYSREEGYWVELPLVPIMADQASRALARIITEEGPQEMSALFNAAITDEQVWSLFQNVSNLDAFEGRYIRPLSQQGFLQREGSSISAGRMWQLLQPYYEVLDSLGSAHQNLGQLADSCDWFHEEELRLC